MKPLLFFNTHTPINLWDLRLREGKTIILTALKDATMLVMSGEPIAGYGPFVMNSQEEIQQTVNDFNAGLRPLSDVNMYDRAFGTQYLQFLYIALMLSGCNPEQQWQFKEITDHFPGESECIAELL